MGYRARCRKAACLFALQYAAAQQRPGRAAGPILHNAQAPPAAAPLSCVGLFCISFVYFLYQISILSHLHIFSHLHISSVKGVAFPNMLWYTRHP